MNKEFIIALKAMGGSQAAAEISKPEKALEEMRISLDELQTAIRNTEAPNQSVQRYLNEMGVASASLSTRIQSASKAFQNLDRQQQRAGKSSANAGMAVLEASRALEDLQYGVRGVLNNLPVLVASLGGGAGLAGVISIAAVALANIVPKLFDLGEAVDVNLPKLTKGNQDAAKAAREAEAAQAALADRVGDSADEIERWRGNLQRAADTASGLEDEQLGRRLAEINLDELRGNLSAAEAELARFDARRTAAVRNRVREEEALQRDLENQRRRFEEINPEFRAAQERQRVAGLEVDRLRTSPVGSLPQLSGLRTARNQAADEYAALLREATQADGTIKGSAQELAAIEEAKVKVEEANKAVQERRQELIDAAVASYDAITAELVTLASARQQAITGLESSAGALREFQGPGAERFGIQQETAGLEMSAALEKINQAAKDAETVTGAGSDQAFLEAATPALDELQSLANEVRTKGSRSEQIFAQQLLEGIAAIRDGIQPGEIEALAGPLNNLTGQVRTNFDQVYNRLDQLGRQIEQTADQLANLDNR